MSRPDGETPRILLMCYSLARGGAERVTVELARAWAERGWHVTVLTMAPAERDFFVLDARVRHVRLPLPTRSGGVLVSLVNNLRRIAAIRAVLKEFKPDVALGMMSASAILLALSGVGLPGRRYGSERTYPPMMPLLLGKGPLRTFAYGLLDGVVCQTSAAATWVSKHTWARATPVAPNPVALPLPRHEPEIRPSVLLGANDRCLLAVGRFSEEKQFDKLIAVFERLAPQHPGWKLVVVGEGPDRADLMTRVAASGLGDRILLPGASGNVGDWYARADLFALTSRFEGFPNVLLEALAHGAPAVAFDCLAGPADIIDPGENGVLVPPGDFAALEVELSRLMGDDSLRARLAGAAPKVNERFSRERVMRLWNEALGLPGVLTQDLAQKEAAE